MSAYSETDYMSLQYDNALDVIRVTWLRNPSSEEYREGFMKAFDLHSQCRSFGWLTDLRLQGLISPADRKWMEEELMPKAVSNGLRCAAAVLPEDVFKKYYWHQIEKGGKRAGLTTNMFGTVANAEAWLIKEKKPFPKNLNVIGPA